MTYEPKPKVRLNGDVLRKARGERSPEEVAAALGLTPTTIAMAEAGAYVQQATLEKLRRYYDLSLGDLVALPRSGDAA